MSRYTHWVIEGLLWAGAVVLFIFLFFQNVAPTGIWKTSRVVGEPSPFMSRLLPDDRAEEAKDGTRILTGEPLYFTVDPPRQFNTAEFAFTFSGEPETPIIEVGVLREEASESYELKPLWNRLIEDLDWPRYQLPSGEWVYDRNGTFASAGEFLQNQPDQDEILTYHASDVLSDGYSILGYRPSSVVRSLNTTLRGEHELLVYMENERLNLSAMYMDMNRSVGADDVSLLVFNQDSELVASAFREDDGDETASAIGRDRQTISLNADLPTGVYKVILKANRDIFFRQLQTPLQKLVILNELYLGDDVGYQPTPVAARVWTDVKNLTIETPHAEGVQTLSIGGELIDVAIPLEPVRHTLTAPGVVLAESPVGDVILAGRGVYALAPDMYFQPEPRKLEWNTNIDALGINYLITSYQRATDAERGVETTVEFDVRQAPLVRDAWKFTVSIPGIYEHQLAPELHRMDATLKREKFNVHDLWNALR